MNAKPSYPEPNGPATEEPTPGRIWSSAGNLREQAVGMSGHFVYANTNLAYLWMGIPDPEGRVRLLITQRAPKFDQVPLAQLQDMCALPATEYPTVDRVWQGPTPDWHIPVHPRTLLTFGMPDGRWFAALILPAPGTTAEDVEMGLFRKVALIRAEVPAPSDAPELHEGSPSFMALEDGRVLRYVK